MRITIKTSSYNQKRHSTPWIAKVLSWEKGQPKVEWGTWVGRPGNSGQLEIEADPGDLIRTGQKDYRRVWESESNWGIVQPDGSLEYVTPVEAREHWISRKKVEDIPKNYIVLALKKHWTVVGQSEDLGQAVKMLNISREDGYEAYIADLGKMIATTPDYVLSEIEASVSNVIPNRPKEE